MTSATQTPPTPTGSLPTQPATAEPPFGVNEMRLSAAQWLVTLGIVVVCAVTLPHLWKAAEPFPTGADYRIPYSLSADYWLYRRRVEQDAGPDQVLLLGDSVVWGEYVRRDGTLSHFLNEQTGRPDRFVNCGVNGLFPLAMEGLVADYGRAIRGRKVIVHCNLLWLTSPKADLSGERPESFNHSRLVPQFAPRIASYRADANTRISAIVERRVGYFAWTDHLQNAYYDQRSLPQWTLEEGGGDPPSRPNAWRNPVAPLRAGIPAEPANDPARGPDSPRHKAWDAGGGEPSHFDWVELDKSLQWGAFRRVVQTLRGRGDDVMVVIGPFNEHLVGEEQRPQHRALRDGIASWLRENHVAVVIPQTLPSAMYADASHPLTGGYSLLAGGLLEEPAFKNWLGAPDAGATAAKAAR
jgi:hypothetical protein